MKISERGATKKRLKFCLTEEKQKFVALLDVRFSHLMQVCLIKPYFEKENITNYILLNYYQLVY